MTYRIICDRCGKEKVVSEMAFSMGDDHWETISLRHIAKTLCADCSFEFVQVFEAFMDKLKLRVQY